jgi:hypothetical protein
MTFTVLPTICTRTALPVSPDQSLGAIILSLIARLLCYFHRSKQDTKQVNSKPLNLGHDCVTHEMIDFKLVHFLYSTKDCFFYTKEKHQKKWTEKQRQNISNAIFLLCSNNFAKILCITFHLLHNHRKQNIDLHHSKSHKLCTNNLAVHQLPFSFCLAKYNQKQKRIEIICNPSEAKITKKSAKLYKNANWFTFD